MSDPRPVQMPAITRLEIIDDRGRTFTAYYPQGGIELHVQDDGRTVKIFAGAHGSWEDLGVPSDWMPLKGTP